MKYNLLAFRLKLEIIIRYDRAMSGSCNYVVIMTASRYPFVIGHQYGKCLGTHIEYYSEIVLSEIVLL